ncbi:MAG: SGNH/GDSL hydrolase family protein [Burkholderiales bacterium]|nr:SGNH/GDSL hydrolase family protein [Burkholderiales bacterium]
MDASIGLRVLNAGLRTDRLSINDQGFRGPPIEVPKSAQGLRLAFLGASTTFCAEVSNNDAVWASLVTERIRQAYPGRAIDFVNGGVPGYTVASSRKNLQHRITALAPDIIVIYHATNDLSGEVRALAVAAGIPGAAESGRMGWLERNSLLWELVVKNLRVRNAQRDSGEVPRLSVDARALGANFRRELTELVREAKASAPLVAVATFSTRLRASQSLEEKRQAAVSALVYMPFMTVDGLIESYARYNQIIREVAAQEGALVIEGEHDIPGDAAHFFDTVHFSDAGSRAMAKRVADALLAASEFKAVAEAPRRQGPPAGR